MYRNYETLYASGISEAAVDRAVSVTLDKFEEIKAADIKLADPIINRELIAIVVALKPGSEEHIEESILSVARIGKIPTKMYEKFALKAVSRAFSQQKRGIDTDIEPMEKLAWLPEASIYEASSASVNGIHVGFSGGWAHHGRLLAVSFASSVAGALELPTVEPATVELFDDEKSLERLKWLNSGQDSGDNLPEHDIARQQYRFIFDKIACKCDYI
ncbi:MAG TPA: hypothetical protein VFN31_00585 [Candidatus Saccharimonadales bacterium]|nr:hypothetical protein [Candidatus Saccharimonadales bacterium]